DIFWIDMGEPFGAEPGFRRPHVVIQNNIFNQSRIQTIVTCAITTNLRLAQARGNVLLRKGEANLPLASVVNISQIVTLDKSRFVEQAGTLSKLRLREVLTGIRLLVEPKE
ncbi:MAG: type II toxin-antitoxin system PemK/MazF family toxin, partial [Chloroflexota bacterium]|nr:type II toxin-antitoxin system PemK/MazF family toxin [Chloroflexota bacterium]